jgi:hypothetical protein
LRFASLAFACVSLALIGPMVSGCRKPARSSSDSAQQEQSRQAGRGEALLKAAAAQLSDLPAAVDTELRPPTVILDSRKSVDHQDVLATCSAASTTAKSFNVIHVPAGNSGLRNRLGVRPGDILKYFILEDKTVDPDSQKSGLSRQVAMELVIAQVIDDNTLLLETGLNGEVPEPGNKIEIWRNVDDRLVDLHEKFRVYEINRWPALAWEPAPDEQVLTQVMATWLNPWVRQTDPKTTGQLDPLIDPLIKSFDTELRSDKELTDRLTPSALSARAFLPEDGRTIQEAIWLRDISKWSHGKGFDDISRATALFDWTVRNIQLQADDAAEAHRPWQTLLYGRGTAEQRAWVFALLARQRGLDVVMLAISPTQPADTKSVSKSDSAKFWLPALLSEGQLYLFDSQLGLPIPGPGGKGVATLEQVRKDDGLLRQLDVEGGAYPVSAKSLQNVEVELVADPFSLSRRASQMEASLTGDERVVLTARPSELAARLHSRPGVSTIRLWNYPFQTLHNQLSLGKPARHQAALAFEPFAMRPALWKGRTRHFQGRHEDALGDALESKDKRPVAGYMSKSVRPTEKEIAESSSEDKRRVDTTAKLDAAYWVGLMTFDDGKFAVSASWLSRPELTVPGSPWAFGASYNLARALEAQGKFEEAIAILQRDSSPQQHGNKLRARALQARLKDLKEMKQNK